jgi:ABC-type taurine transport system substrate-binding protein
MSDTTDAINKLADELGLSVEEVELQTSGSIWTSLEEMQSDLFIEGYINTMVEQTVFLQNQDFIDRSIDYDEMAAFINESYAKDVTVE